MDENSTLLSQNTNGFATDEEREEEEDKYQDVKKLEQHLAYAGLGVFHVILLLISGLATAADAVEIFGVSFVVPIADEDLSLSSADKGYLDASIFVGKLANLVYFGDVNVECKVRTYRCECGVQSSYIRRQ